MASEDGDEPASTLSQFELILSCHPPILESILLHSSTSTIFKLYHTSSYLRQFLRRYPTAWKHLSFRLLQPSSTQIPHSTHAGSIVPRQSRNYALDQLLLHVVNPFSTCLRSLELDNTAISGQILISTVLSLRRESLEHVSVRGCKNVSLKYHIVPWLTLFSLQQVGQGRNATKGPAHQELALKSLYTYRCRHHRRRPYLPSSLTRKDSDSEPTHELVTLCHQLGIWTDTAWCTTPGVRCFRRRGYLSMRAPVDTKEVWVVYDRLWRSKNWVGVNDEKSERSSKRDGRFWEQDEDGQEGEALGVADRGSRYSEGKQMPMHLRKSHQEFVRKVTCDNCSASILERCEQCSVLMHCAGCRKTMCASCAFERPYTRNKPEEARAEGRHRFWWAPGCSVSPCSMQDQDDPVIIQGQSTQPPNPASKFKWCCTEPVFSGGGGITFGPGNSARDYEKMRAAPLPRSRGWEDPEFRQLPQGTEDERFQLERTALTKSEHNWGGFLQLLGGPEKQPTPVPRNLCDDCHSSVNWKVKCKACTQSLCLQHDMRGLKMRICGYRELGVEKENFHRQQICMEKTALSIERLRQFLPGNAPPAAFWSRDRLAQPVDADDGDSTNAQLGLGPRLPTDNHGETDPGEASSSAEPERPARPTSPSSNATAVNSRCTSPAPSVDSVAAPTQAAEKAPAKGPKGPEWLGCFGFACPPYRHPGDHRMRCTASFKECAKCKIQVCKECTDSMMKPCRCEGCVDRSSVTTPAGSTAAPAVPALLAFANPDPPAPNLPPPAPVTVGNPQIPPFTNGNPSGMNWEGTKFWCPNCRWARIQDGQCKARQYPKIKNKGKGKDKGKGKAKEKTRHRASTSSDATTRPVPVPSGIDDETAQNVAEFEDLVERGDETVVTEAETVAGPSNPPTTSSGRVDMLTGEAASSSEAPTILPLLPLSSIAEEVPPLQQMTIPSYPPSSITLLPPLPLLSPLLVQTPPTEDGPIPCEPGAQEAPPIQDQVTPSEPLPASQTNHEALGLDLDRVDAMVANLQARIVKLRLAYNHRQQASQGEVSGQTGGSSPDGIASGNGSGSGSGPSTGGLNVETEQANGLVSEGGYIPVEEMD